MFESDEDIALSPEPSSGRSELIRPFEIHKKINESFFLVDQIHRNRLTCSNLISEFFTSLSSLEVLAFDFSLALFLMDQADFTFVDDFIEKSTSPFNLFDTKHDNFYIAADYIMHLYERSFESFSLFKSNSSFDRSKQNLGDIFQSLKSKIITIKSDVEFQMKDFKWKTIKPPKSTSPKERNSQSDTQDKLFEWAQKRLSDFTKCNFEISNFRILLGSILHNASISTYLQSEIDASQYRYLQPAKIDYTVFGVENIVKSPYFLTLVDNFSFLLQVKDSIQFQFLHVIPYCQYILKDSNQSFLNLQSKVLSNLQESDTLVTGRSLHQLNENHLLKPSQTKSRILMRFSTPKFVSGN